MKGVRLRGIDVRDDSLRPLYHTWVWRAENRAVGMPEFPWVEVARSSHHDARDTCAVSPPFSPAQKMIVHFPKTLDSPIYDNLELGEIHRESMNDVIT